MKSDEHFVRQYTVKQKDKSAAVILSTSLSPLLGVGLGCDSRWSFSHISHVFEHLKMRCECIGQPCSETCFFTKISSVDEFTYNDCFSIAVKHPFGDVGHGETEFLETCLRGDMMSTSPCGLCSRQQSLLFHETGRSSSTSLCQR